MNLPAAKEAKVTLSDRFLAATFLKLLPRRVTPNQLTIFRFFMVPVVAFFVYTEAYLIALPLFVFAAFTDALDGALARIENKITEWGKTYDPMADKLLIGLTAVIIIPKYLDSALAFLIIFMEMFLIGTAYYLKNKGTIEISANVWGKAKMILQSVGLGLLLLGVALSIPPIFIWAQYILYTSLVFAVISLITYGI